VGREWVRGGSVASNKVRGFQGVYLPTGDGPNPGGGGGGGGLFWAVSGSFFFFLKDRRANFRGRRSKLQKTEITNRNFANEGAGGPGGTFLAHLYETFISLFGKDCGGGGAFGPQGLYGGGQRGGAPEAHHQRRKEKPGLARDGKTGRILARGKGQGTDFVFFPPGRGNLRWFGKNEGGPQVANCGGSPACRARGLGAVCAPMGLPFCLASDGMAPGENAAMAKRRGGETGESCFLAGGAAALFTGKAAHGVGDEMGEGKGGGVKRKGRPRGITGSRKALGREIWEGEGGGRGGPRHGGGRTITLWGGGGRFLGPPSHFGYCQGPRGFSRRSKATFHLGQDDRGSV